MTEESTEPHVIRSIRIPESLDMKLRKISKEMNTSVNALAERSLTKFAEFDRYAEEMNYTVVPKRFLVKGLGFLSDAEIRDYGEWSAVGPGSDTVQFYQKQTSLAAVLNTFEGIGAKYSRLFSFHHEVEGKNHSITLNHGMGMKWSLFYDANLKKVFKESLGIELRTEVTENVVTGHFVETPLGEAKEHQGIDISRSEVEASTRKKAIR